MVDLSFSITECTGSPKIAAEVRSLNGRWFGWDMQNQEYIIKYHGIAYIV
jgi:hypothetical protein